MRLTHFKVFFIIFYFLVSSCSAIFREVYYAPDIVPEGWSFLFKEGQASTKQLGEPDQAILTYSHEKFELSVQTQYQRKLKSGPLWFAIFPSSVEGQHDMSIFLHLWSHIKKKDKTLGIDPLKWVVMVNNGETAMTPELAHRGEYQGVEIFIVKYNVKVDNVERLKIRFEGIKSQGEEIHVPNLELNKKNGSLRREQFTL